MNDIIFIHLLEVLKNILFIKSSDSSIDSINQWREIFSQQMTTSSHKEKFSNLNVPSDEIKDKTGNCCKRAIFKSCCIIWYCNL